MTSQEPTLEPCPTKFRHVPLSAMTHDEGVELSIPTAKHENDDFFLSMVHVALHTRGDMLSHPCPDGIQISEDKAIDCIPDNLYMFLNHLLGGQQLLEMDESEEDNDDSLRQTRILSIA